MGGISTFVTWVRVAVDRDGPTFKARDGDLMAVRKQLCIRVGQFSGPKAQWKAERRVGDFIGDNDQRVFLLMAPGGFRGRRCCEGRA